MKNNKFNCVYLFKDLKQVRFLLKFFKSQIMEIKKTKKSMLNATITSKVIEWQEKGYDFDFLLLANSTLICMQTNAIYHLKDVNVKNILQRSKVIAKHNQQMLSVETSTGERGLLLTDKI